MSDSAATTRRARALWRAERWADAARVWALASAEAPSNAEARRHLAASLWRAGRRPEALAALRDGLLAHPAEPELWADLLAALDLVDPDAAATARDTSPLDLSRPSELARLSRAGVAALRRLLDHAPTEPREVPVWLALLGRLSPALADDRLRAVLADERAAIREAAVATLVELATRRPAAYLDLLAETADHAELLDPLATALESAGAALRETLAATPDPRLRGLAREALVRAGDLAGLQALAAGASRAEQLALLGAYARLGAWDELAVGLYESDPLIRAEAGRRLAELGLPEATAVLRERLAIETNPTVRAILEQACASPEPTPPPTALTVETEPSEGNDARED